MPVQKGRLQVGIEIREKRDSDDLSFICFHRSSQTALASGHIEPNLPRFIVNWPCRFAAQDAAKYFQSYDKLPAAEAPLGGGFTKIGSDTIWKPADWRAITAAIGEDTQLAWYKFPTCHVSWQAKTDDTAQVFVITSGVYEPLRLERTMQETGIFRIRHLASEIALVLGELTRYLPLEPPIEAFFAA
jgi:hypothetical protein